tara:strand:+ start:1184 stop:1495 length:312 start_codon:yes stop_codon:yes gene_type:complete
MKNLNYLLLLLILLNSCGGLREAGKVLRNEKTLTTDEFLVEKKEPLVMPPDFKKIPKPGSLTSKQVDEKKRIKNILTKEDIQKNNKKQTSSSGVEQSIIEQIR